jgi:hypothetical protein
MFKASPAKPMKNDEFDIYCSILKACGESAEREIVRVPQPNGRPYLMGTFIGRVPSREDAEMIRAKCKAHLGYLGPWSVEETDD